VGRFREIRDRVIECNPTNVGDLQKIEAESAQQAAEIAYPGIKLRTEGKPGELRLKRDHPYWVKEE
jgi:hypothetical protein